MPDWVPEWLRPRSNLLQQERLTSSLRDLVDLAQSLESVWDFDRVLARIGRTVGARACILWEVEPDGQLQREPTEGRLLVLAQWFADTNRDWTQLSMPIAGSLTGAAISQNRILVIDSIEDDERIVVRLPFLKDANFTRACVVPLALANGCKTALALYRTRTDARFDADELALAEQLAVLLPMLYQATWDRVELDVVSDRSPKYCVGLTVQG